MSDNDKLKFQARIEELVLSYRRGLPPAFNRIGTLWSALNEGRWDIELFETFHTEIHKLAGSAAISGMHEISRIALEIDQLCSDIERQSTQPGVQLRAQISRRLDTLRSAVIKE